MSGLYRNLSVFYIALVASLMAWMYGGTRGGLLIPVVPWLLVFMLEIIVCFPQTREGEDLRHARERVWEAMRLDPLVWLAVIFIVLLTIPFVNTGLCPVCDARVIAAGADPDPAVPFLPFCVNRLDHLNVWYWFAISLSAMVAVKHGLRRRGQRLLVEILVWNGVALAILGFVQNICEAPGPLWNTQSGLKHAAVGDFFSTFGYPNMGGDYFTSLFALAFGLWRWHYDLALQAASGNDPVISRSRHRFFWKKHYCLIPTVLFFFAALATLSRAAIMLVTLLAVVFFLHTLLSFVARMHRARRAKVAMLSVLALVVIGFLATIFMPEDMQREVDTIGTKEVLDRVTGRSQYHVRVATELWKDHPLFGCGGWGYIHLSIPKMTEVELGQLQKVGGINVHNDHLQFLAEHGLVGVLLLAAMVALLVLPVMKVWGVLAKAARFSAHRKHLPRPVQVFVMPTPVFAMYAAIAATLVHAFGDCPLRSPAVMMLFFIILAAVPGFVPRIELPESTR